MYKIEEIVHEDGSRTFVASDEKDIHYDPFLTSMDVDEPDEERRRKIIEAVIRESMDD